MSLLNETAKTKAGIAHDRDVENSIKGITKLFMLLVGHHFPKHIFSAILKQCHCEALVT